MLPVIPSSFENIFFIPLIPHEFPLTLDRMNIQRKGKNNKKKKKEQKNKKEKEKGKNSK